MKSLRYHRSLVARSSHPEAGSGCRGTGRGRGIRTSSSGCREAVPARPGPSGPSPAQAQAQALPKPLLLLEGDPYRCSDRGIARSLYQLADGKGCPGASPSVSIEELYDIGGSRKAFLVRRHCHFGSTDGAKSKTSAETNAETSTCPETDREPTDLPLGDPIEDISPLWLREIPGGAPSVARVGTGGRTWDSSIAMALYLGARPELLAGRAVELGSGVGLGGILAALLRSPKLVPAGLPPFRSLTLTDHQEEVLRRCSEHVAGARTTAAAAAIPPLRVAPLDWHGVSFGTSLQELPDPHTGGYDTVLACDCAYRSKDVPVLAAAVGGLLKRKRASRAHLFGPVDRGGLGDLLAVLRDDPALDVRTDTLRMVRYGLEAPGGDRCGGGDPLEDAARVCSEETARSGCHSRHASAFLHIEASLRLDPHHHTGDPREASPAWDID